MKVFFTLLIVLVIVVIALGFYLGWFHISSASTGNKSHVTMTVNQAKIRADKNKVVNDVRGLKPTSTRPSQ
ncbi:MAG: hypothetical protein M1588_02245 [Planctomycetes bacterium]|jgi:cell division protein FtsX|nr:hypothetical protein [Planctomycetota bacterium]